MGSPVSPVVANTYMEYFEDLAMTTSPNSPRVWKWYVDDTFCILKKTAVLETLNHLNGIRPTMQFMIKEEKEDPHRPLPAVRVASGRNPAGEWLPKTVYPEIPGETTTTRRRR